MLCRCCVLCSVETSLSRVVVVHIYCIHHVRPRPYTQGEVYDVDDRAHSPDHSARSRTARESGCLRRASCTARTPRRCPGTTPMTRKQYSRRREQRSARTWQRASNVQRATLALPKSSVIAAPYRSMPRSSSSQAGLAAATPRRSRRRTRSNRARGCHTVVDAGGARPREEG